MAYDIYGNNLRKGFCEVHPHVNEEYPCSLCYSEERLNRDNRQPEPPAQEWTKELQEGQNEYDLKEMAHWYGGWDKLREVIQQLEDNENEAAGERAMNEPGAWEGGFADNH